MLIYIVGLLALGLAAGSFVNALVWRLHEQSKKDKERKTKGKNLSILNGRSMCVHCHHVLAWYDLIPILSWAALKGKCRYCGKPISAQYPIVETITALVFVLSYVFWPTSFSADGEWLLLATWLAGATGLVALAVYDLKWMLLPNKIIYPTLIVAATGRAVYIAVFSDRVWHALFLWAFSVVIASGVFYVLFMVSKGKWIGYGDVRLGLVTGTLLADPELAVAMIFVASLIGTLVVLPALLKGRRTLASRLPYGPFLIAGTAIILLFGESLLNWYKDLIL
jgi:prepilin signal peptidase PulO-like enzyme (type II secretory pathway)